MSICIKPKQFLCSTLALALACAWMTQSHNAAARDDIECTEKTRLSHNNGEITCKIEVVRRTFNPVEFEGTVQTLFTQGVDFSENAFTPTSLITITDGKAPEETQVAHTYSLASLDYYCTPKEDPKLRTKVFAQIQLEKKHRDGTVETELRRIKVAFNHHGIGLPAFHSSYFPGTSSWTDAIGVILRCDENLAVKPKFLQ